MLRDKIEMLMFCFVNVSKYFYVETQHSHSSLWSSLPKSISMNWKNMDNVIFFVRENAVSYLVIIVKKRFVCNVPVVMSSHIIKIRYWSFVRVVKKPWKKSLFFVVSKK